ncbi:MAG: HDIG domain-containing metalloprotein [Candidatus Omnitrophota bacterium]
MIKIIDKTKIKQKRILILFWIVLAFFISYMNQVNLVVPLFLACLFAYVKFRKLNVRFMHLIFMFLITFVSSFFIINERLPIYFHSFSAIPMLAALLFNNLEIALLLALASAVSVASLGNSSPLQLCILFLVGGIISSPLVMGARKRTTIIRAGLLVGIACALSLFFMQGFGFYLPKRYIFLILNGIISSGVVLLLLPVFEYLFQTVTNISLLELADFQHPLLQRMVMEAPGTYHHSLVVGNLSDTACEVVGANSLLARIGAYYHDIGKLQKPNYFSENMDIESSKHDALAPSMSKLIIMNHVKEGMELARKYKLKPPLIDFIQRHHGNSLVFYFYQRALEKLEEDQEVKEEGFRYPGPKPNTKETAIVLLADSVEAATRALKEPTPKKIEEVVHKIINNKFIDGQLDECDLTLKDLERISAVFIRILSGIYHSRVTYPEENKSESNPKKSSKENSAPSEKDKTSHP